MVELLLANGADANARNDYGNTPLHFAGMLGHKDAAELLLANNLRSRGYSVFVKWPRTGRRGIGSGKPDGLRYATHRYRRSGLAMITGCEI